MSQKDEIFNAYQFILFPKIFAKAKCRTAYIVNSYLCKIRKLYSFQYAQKITRTHQTFLTVMMRKWNRLRWERNLLSLFTLWYCLNSFLNNVYEILSQVKRSLILLLLLLVLLLLLLLLLLSLFFIPTLKELRST